MSGDMKTVQTQTIMYQNKILNKTALIQMPLSKKNQLLEELKLPTKENVKDAENAIREHLGWPGRKSQLSGHKRKPCHKKKIAANKKKRDATGRFVVGTRQTDAATTEAAATLLALEMQPGV